MLYCEQRHSFFLIVATIFIVLLGHFKCPLASPDLDYEHGTLIVKLRKEVAEANNLKSSPEKMLSGLNQKWGATAIPFQLQDFSTTPYAALADPDRDEDHETVVVLSFSDEFNMDKVIKDYQESGVISAIEPNYYVYLNQTSIAVHPSQYHNHHHSLNALLAVTSEVTIPVAVLDSGLDINHPALRNKVYTNNREIPFNNIDDDNNGYIDDYQGLSFIGFSKTNQTSTDISDSHGHGTHISGIIAAQSIKDGIYGINPQAKIIPIKFIDSTGKGTQLDAAMAIRYAVDMGARVINCSWGYFKKSMLLEDAITYAVKRGAIVVCSVGNSNSHIPEYPASFTNVITVGALKKDLSRANYSSYGSHLDFMAFGDAIYSTLPNNAYGTLSGTSQATAIVSGIISKAVSLYPAVTKLGVYELLKNNTLKINPSGYSLKTGHGMINANNMLTELGASPDSYVIHPLPTNSPSDSSSPSVIQSLRNDKRFWAVLGTVIAVIFGFSA